METTPSARMRRAAMNLLARREHSRKELMLKLNHKFCLSGSGPKGLEREQQEREQQEREQLERELDKLRDEGLQSDRRLAENFIHSRTTKGQGPVKIRSELRNKGVDEAVIEESLSSADINWSGLADRVVLKRFGDMPPKDVKEKAKRIRFLQQRGFGFEHFESRL